MSMTCSVYCAAEHVSNFQVCCFTAEVPKLRSLKQRPTRNRADKYLGTQDMRSELLDWNSEWELHWKRITASTGLAHRGLERPKRPLGGGDLFSRSFSVDFFDDFFDHLASIISDHIFNLVLQQLSRRPPGSLCPAFSTCSPIFRFNIVMVLTIQ